MRFFILITFFLLSLQSFSQLRINSHKYPSLMWEIRGNGMQKPSYLFGTMHVSSKMAFHLSDSFYLAIRNADVVALETNPESWQDDLTGFDVDAGDDASWQNYTALPEDYFTINSLRFEPYEKLLEEVLAVQPATINNLLYRNYSDISGDYEEDTFLDMYIYQVGKKLGKRVTGVERYEESMRLMMEAYRDAAKEKIKQSKTFDFDENLSPEKLQEAYRLGNLDLLDSINRVNSFSDAFDEKFLYRRNEIQAASIDSIIKTKSSLFVGVGAAHLPGNRGVIEILRRKGYTVRPVVMGIRDSRQKEQVEKIRVPVKFSKQVSADGFFSVEMPGKLFRFDDNVDADQLQYADMANGSYYSVTRVKTNSGLWGHSMQTVLQKMDSLLYENIPGKILAKKNIVKDGYNGFDIINRTRRGDVQRYNIFVTPYEVLVFKMSGNGDYVAQGNEPPKFFNSIHLQEYRSAGWQKFQPSFGGFSVLLPQEPVENNDGNLQFDAIDQSNGNHYTVIKTDVHNYHFAGEDKFDLGLMQESFVSSVFIDTVLQTQYLLHKNYPAFQALYRNKNGGYTQARFIIMGPHYYTLLAQGKKKDENFQVFFNSFNLESFQYNNSLLRKDSMLHFMVTSPVWQDEPNRSKIKISNSKLIGTGNEDAGVLTSRSRVVRSAETGEQIYVAFLQASPYHCIGDSVQKQLAARLFRDDQNWLIRDQKKMQSDGWAIKEMILSEAGSSRTLHAKIFGKDGVAFLLAAQGDTISKQSVFVKDFFESFHPQDSLTGCDENNRDNKLFFADAFSGDSFLRRKALTSLSGLETGSGDVASLKKLVASLSWNEKNYLELKKVVIEKISTIQTNEATDLLKQLYKATTDTVEFQYPILQSMLQQGTVNAYKAFAELVMADPPVLQFGNTRQSRIDLTNDEDFGSSLDGNFISPLYDSLKLTRTIIKELLPLINLDEYKSTMLHLLSAMVDSNLLSKNDYANDFEKLLLEAKLSLKKQMITEKKAAIQAARDQKTDESISLYEVVTEGNDGLLAYATLLLPFWENKEVQIFFNRLLSSTDKKLQFDVAALMLRHRKTVPDQVLNGLAADDAYRYPLFITLQNSKNLQKFPAGQLQPALLAKSMLLVSRKYSRPDSLGYVDKSTVTINGEPWLIYFFRYSQRQEDMNWKLAAISFKTTARDLELSDPALLNRDKYFTDYTGIRWDENQIKSALEQVQKRLIYGRTKSGKMFYQEKTEFEAPFDAAD